MFDEKTMSGGKQDQPNASLRLLPVGVEESAVIIVNGLEVVARSGETLAAALLAAGFSALQRSSSGEPRGLFCGMGVCYGCLITVNGQPLQRACLTHVEAGMQVETEDRWLLA
jgi:predicted molibdopterin-dependent oxidoreductase YjgC